MNSLVVGSIAAQSFSGYTHHESPRRSYLASLILWGRLTFTERQRRQPYEGRSWRSSMLDHPPVTVGAPGTLTSMTSPLCRVAPASSALTSSYLALSWLASPISTTIGVVIASWTQP